MLSESVVIKLRAAAQEDCQTIFDWRNDPIIRSFSFNSDPLNFQDHEKWFEKTLTREDVILLIAESMEEGLGTIRFDMQEETAIISIYLAPAFIGQGYGKALLKEGEKFLKKHYPHIRKMEARIMPANIRSKKLFSSSGYLPQIEIYAKELL